MYHTFGKPALPPLDFVSLLRTSAIQVKLDDTRFVVGCKEASVPPAARLSHPQTMHNIGAKVGMKTQDKDRLTKKSVPFFFANHI